MGYNPQNPNGQAIKANSAPVVLAIEQEPLSVTGPLTDVQLRATPVPVSGTVATGGLTDTELRATPVPVSISSDIEIGAVEIKNGTDDTRVTVKTDGTNNAMVVTANVLPLPTGAATAALQTQPGVDIGDVTINNGAGAAAVNIQDGGNSITVDGTVSATQSGAWSVDTSSNAVVNAGNSTTTPLGIGGVFTGSSIDLLNYSTLRVSYVSDKASATNGFSVQFSNNNVNWDFNKVATYTDIGNGMTVVFNRVARYARIVYTNGAVAQTYFRLQTLIVPNSAEFVRHFMDDVPQNSDTGIMTQSVLVGKTTAGGGAFVNVKVNPSGALSADVSGSTGVGVTGPLTDAELRATPVPIIESAPTSVTHAKVPVPTAGVRVQLATNTAKAIVVKALAANTGIMYVGGSTVSAANGFPLAAGDTVALDINNTNVIWVDASVNGDSVNWMANN